jgi:hypothetical protein
MSEPIVMKPGIKTLLYGALSTAYLTGYTNIAAAEILGVEAIR